MAVLKQRKIDGKRRVFRDKLTDQYYFKAQKEIPVCLVCSETTSSIPSVDRLVIRAGQEYFVLKYICT